MAAENDGHSTVRLISVPDCVHTRCACSQSCTATSSRSSAMDGRMTRVSNSSDDLYACAQRVTPGGVNSPVRAFGAVGGAPRFITRAEGAYLFDADGNDYVDLICSWGPTILGHAHPAVVEAVRVAAEKGLSFGAPTEAEIELAE